MTYPFNAYVSGRPVTVIGETTGRGGKKLFIVRRADGTEFKVINLDSAVEFAPAISAAEFYGSKLPSSADALRAKINRYR